MSSSEETAGRGTLGEIPWRDVQALVAHVLQEADGRGLPIVVAVVDRWGRQLAFQRQPGALIASSAVGAAKALTACTFDAPTHVLLETITRHDQLELGRANPGLVFAGGGFPIRVAGLLVGGIGVSGASSAEEDSALAVNALREGGFDADFQ